MVFIKGKSHICLLPNSGRTVSKSPRQLLSDGHGVLAGGSSHLPEGTPCALVAMVPGSLCKVLASEELNISANPYLLASCVMDLKGLQGLSRLRGSRCCCPGIESISTEAREVEGKMHTASGLRRTGQWVTTLSLNNSLLLQILVSPDSLSLSLECCPSGFWLQPCAGFLWLLGQIPISLVAESNRNVLSQRTQLH